MPPLLSFQTSDSPNLLPKRPVSDGREQRRQADGWTANGGGGTTWSIVTGDTSNTGSAANADMQIAQMALYNKNGPRAAIIADVPKVTVVIPVGPSAPIAFVRQTVESVKRSLPDARLILVDDSRSDLGVTLARDYGFHRLPAVAQGLHGALYLNLSEAFRAALAEPFDLLLRLDTDALVLNGDFADMAHRYAEAHPNVGCLGSFRVTYGGAKRRHAWSRRMLAARIVLSPFSVEGSWLFLPRVYARALRHGYRLGEAVMGGACIYTRAAIQAMNDHGLLSRVELARVGVEEDHIFGLCLSAAGFNMADFGTANDALPMGVKHVGLPASPAELVAASKSIVHSTKGWGNMDEAAVRREFAHALGWPEVVV
jgi:hypothetical protein